jgi:peroxiredoxin Q/BCP
MKGLSEGDKVPSFTLLDQEGRPVDMAAHIGKKPMVIYFYPADFTTGCTMEAHAFREMHEAFQKEGAEVFGISSDTVESHKKFAIEHELPFSLLSDPSDKVRSIFGAFGIAGTPGRVTYVIDKEGTVKKIYSSQIHPKKHSEEAMSAVKELGN